MAAYQSITNPVKPVREIRMDRFGGLLMTRHARYDDLAQYITQMGTPLSSLAGVGCFTFDDPIDGVILLVECTELDEDLD